MRRVGFVVNPIAGMGGRVGLKGTDGVLAEAIERGATPRAGERALEMLASLHEGGDGGVADDVEWLTCSGAMGADVLAGSGIPAARTHIVHTVEEGAPTTAMDTITACLAFESEGAELVVFCGGDGTARDVLEALSSRLPVLGVPAGVKMHSGVFGLSPQAAAATLLGFLEGRLTVEDAEVIDLDEDAYREGEWRMRTHGKARTPHAPALVQAGKFMIEAASEQLVLEDIAQGVAEYMEENPSVLWFLGPGGTLKFIGDWIGIEKTLLGIDAILEERQVGKDLDERGLLELLERWPDARVLVSPIGAQGFFLGRGNLQLSPEVVRRVGVDNFWVVSTPSKLERTPVLRVDTGDTELDGQFTSRGQMQVIMGYRTRKYVPLR